MVQRIMWSKHDDKHAVIIGFSFIECANIGRLFGYNAFNWQPETCNLR